MKHSGESFVCLYGCLYNSTHFYSQHHFSKEFQEANGDIDFKVTPFETCQKTGYETRKLTFKTLTKSYFGPTYADAVKTTEVILNKNCK